jgi:hypothetical protein
VLALYRVLRRHKEFIAMLQMQASSAAVAQKLQQIKLLHTAIWAVMAAAILAVPWLSWSGKFRWAFGLSLLVVGECLVLAFNGGRCPLTDIGAHYTSDRACNFDIYLPLWLACYNKQIFGFLFVVGESVVVGRWIGRPGL